MRKRFVLLIIIMLCSSTACITKTQEKKTDTPMVAKNNEGYTTTSLSTNTPAKVYSSIPIVEGFSLEDTTHQQMFVLGDDGIISGKKYWDEFYLNSKNNKNASLIIVRYYKKSYPDDNTPVIYVENLTYTSKQGYTLSSFSDVFRTYHYPYLIDRSGSMPNSNVIMRNYYLVHNPNLTFEKLNKSIYSSNIRDQVDSHMVWFEKTNNDAIKRIDKLSQIQKNSIPGPVKDGRYIANNCKAGMLPVVVIKNGRISFYDMINSQLPSGTSGNYSIKNDVLSMKTDDNKNIYVFLIDGDNLIFQKSESSSTKILNNSTGDRIEDNLIFYR